jgi:hypothetical protein
MVTTTGTAWFRGTVDGKPAKVAVKDPGVRPLPDSVTDSPLATVSVAVAAPTTVGVNVTLIVQLACGVVQVVEATANPVPAATVGVSDTRPPVLVTTTLLGVLTCPMSTSPKVREAVDSVNAGAGGAASVAGASGTMLESLGFASGEPGDGPSLPPQPAAATIPSKPMQAMRNE